MRSALPLLILVASVTAAVASAGCSAEAPEEDTESEDELVRSAGADTPIVVPPPGTTLTELAQPTLMAALEGAGFHFASHFGVASPLDNRSLAQKAPLYDFIASDVAADLDAARARDPRLKTQVSHGVTRILDKGWLKADYARFELTGVVNRLDRMASSGGATCGEVRFLYRLAYTHRPDDPARVSYSRLPIVINVVYDVPRSSPETCRAAATAWHVPANVTDESAYVGYLARDLLSTKTLQLKQVELNAQVLRVPSESKTDLGGLAEYALRVYGLAGATPTLLPLENTPDVERIATDPALKAELAQYLATHVAEIDLGTLQLPSKFLATKVSAFSTFGSARLANKPFTRLFYDSSKREAPALGAVDLSATTHVGNVRGLLARLDDMTCSGCHQGGRSVAGFHFLGEDSLARSHPLNVARIGQSPHSLDETARRRGFVRALASGVEPSPFRPASFVASPAAKRGAPCLMPSAADAFKSAPSCETGLVCTSIADNPRLPVELGQCLPPLQTVGRKTTYATEFAGLPCTKGTIADAPDPRQDAMAISSFACPAPATGGGYTCRPPSIGVPGGLCTQLCGDGNVPLDRKNELCGYAGGKEFDECADRNDFSRCLAGVIKSGLREACDETTPCREDWICQRFIKARTTPPEAPADGRGYCVPTYFLFQVRADGHPNPTPIR